jgi:hypothetical protein
MNKTDFRNILNLQRTYVVSIAAVLDSMEDVDLEKRRMLADDLKHIWLMGEILSKSVGVELDSVNDIIKIGEEIIELQRMYALE